MRVNPDLIKNFSSINTTASSNNGKQSNSLVIASASPNTSKIEHHSQHSASNKQNETNSFNSPLKEHDQLKLNTNSSKSPVLTSKSSILASPNKTTHVNSQHLGVDLIEIDDPANNSNNYQQPVHHSSEINNKIMVVTGNGDEQQHVEMHQQMDEEVQLEDIKFITNEFLIHRSSFSGDFDNYDIWCVSEDKNYLQKYEPVLLSTGERCHQSTDIVSQIFFAF